MKSEWLKFHCLDIPKNECRFKFDHDRPAPENQLEDKTNLKQWAEKDSETSKQLVSVMQCFSCLCAANCCGRADGSGAAIWVRINSECVQFTLTSTSQPFFSLKRRHHGLSGGNTLTTGQSIFVRTFWRLHLLDQLCNSIVYRCANFQCKILRMKETSSCGF
jgi:hypothetical protein